MGQLIIKFRSHNPEPREAQLEVKLQVPPDLEKSFRPTEVILDGQHFKQLEEAAASLEA